MTNTTVAEALPGLGHNQPPEELDILNTGQLQTRLINKYRDMVQRVIELEQGVERAPPVVLDKATATRLTDMVGKQLRPLIDDLKKAHGVEKGPYYQCGRTCDDFFLRRCDRIDAAIKTVERRVHKFQALLREQERKAEEEQRRRAEAEQRRAEAEQRRLEEEARRAAEAGDRQKQAVLATEAEAAGERAQQQAAIVTAPSEPTRIKGDYGSTGFVRTRWDYEVLDPLLVPLNCLTIDDKAVRGLIAEGVREIPGLRIYETEDFTIRRN